jgi:hypothetical protein
MRPKTLVLLGLALLSYCTSSNANITNAWWHDDNDGAVNCSTWNASGLNTSSVDLSMTGVQNWAPGHMIGWAQTDSTADPTLGLFTSVDNDTSFAWTSYQVNVYMQVPFTVVPGSVAVTMPSDWTFSSPTYSTAGPGPFAGDYEATLIFNSGTPLNIGGEMDFDYAIHFASSTDYWFAQEMMPNEVPEPGVFNLATMSGLFFGASHLIKRLGRKV